MGEAKRATINILERLGYRKVQFEYDGAGNSLIGTKGSGRRDGYATHNPNQPR